MTRETVLVTGGLGFIGSHFIDLCIARGHRVVNIDKITYASNLDLGFKEKYGDKYSFIQKDIAFLQELPYCDYIVNFAAESHVDNSIADSQPFINTNILGMYNLLKLLHKQSIETASHLWQSKAPKLVHISTDEVFGDIEKGFFKEEDPLNPSNPYSATKASAELLLKAWSRTYAVKYNITRTTNNYGERQHEEKLIPSAITRALAREKIRIHGTGDYIRNWVYVKDNCEAIYLVMTRGKDNTTYHISSDEEYDVNDIVKMVLDKLGLPFDESTVDYIQNRSGQDVRYALDSSRVKALGWKQAHRLKETLPQMIEYYEKRAKKQ